MICRRQYPCPQNCTYLAQDSEKLKGEVPWELEALSGQMNFFLWLGGLGGHHYGRYKLPLEGNGCGVTATAVSCGPSSLRTTGKGILRSSV